LGCCPMSMSKSWLVVFAHRKVKNMTNPFVIYISFFRFLQSTLFSVFMYYSTVQYSFICDGRKWDRT
jgi:hypothetical protein